MFSNIFDRNYISIKNFSKLVLILLFLTGSFSIFFSSNTKVYASEICSEYSLNINQANPELVSGTINPSDISINDVYVFREGFMDGNNQSFDVVVKLNDKSNESNPYFALDHFLEISDYSINDPYVAFSIYIVEKDSISSINPLGINANITNFNFSISDIDSHPGVNSGDIAGINQISNSTITSIGSSLEMNNFDNGRVLNGFELYRLRKDVLGDPTDWLDEVNSEITDTNNMINYSFDEFSGVEVAFGFTGTNILLDKRGLGLFGSGTHCMLINTNPTANPDVYTTPYNTKLEENIIYGSNSGIDTDPENDNLTIVSYLINNIEYLPSQTAVINEGEISISVDGVMTFIPKDGFVGKVPQFTYTITDGELVDTTTVDIVVEDQKTNVIEEKTPPKTEEKTPETEQIYEVTDDSLGIGGASIEILEITNEPVQQPSPTNTKLIRTGGSFSWLGSAFIIMFFLFMIVVSIKSLLPNYSVNKVLKNSKKLNKIINKLNINILQIINYQFYRLRNKVILRNWDLNRILRLWSYQLL